MKKMLLTDPMIRATMLVTFFLGLALPTINIMVYQNITPRYVAIKDVIIGLGLILVNSLFSKYGDFIFRNFGKLCIIETISYVGLISLTGTGIIGIKVYYILDLFIYVIISRNIVCSSNRMRAYLYKDEMRECFDNTIPVACAIAMLTSSSIVMVCPLNLTLAWVAMGVGVCIDNLIYAIVFKRTYKQMLNDKVKEDSSK